MRWCILLNVIVHGLFVSSALASSERTLSEGCCHVIYLNNTQPNVDTHVRDEKKGLTELRKEILDLQKQKDALERNILGMQKRLVYLFGRGVVNQDSVLKADAELIRAQESLALTAVDAIETMKKASQTLDRILKEGVPTTDEARVAVLEQISDLSYRAGNLELCVLPTHGDTIESSRVLEVNSVLGVVIITAGYKQGVRTGFVFVSGKEKDVELRVMSVRADLSLCEVIKGDFKKVRTGMEVNATR